MSASSASKAQDGAVVREAPESEELDEQGELADATGTLYIYSDCRFNFCAIFDWHCI